MSKDRFKKRQWIIENSSDYIQTFTSRSKIGIEYPNRCWYTVKQINQTKPFYFGILSHKDRGCFVWGIETLLLYQISILDRI